MRRIVLRTAAGLAAVTVAYCGVTLPAASVRLPVAPPPTTVTGAYHVHTERSDGSGTVDDVARAAAAADLQFVIVTDHHTAANAAVVPSAPAYLHGVLVIDAMEISTQAGHLVALGLPGPPPYPLGGEARDVIEDVHRLGGWTVAAHPDSPKTDLQWRGGRTDALEWINADSEWRVHPPRRLLQAALHSVIRPASAIASLFSRPDVSLQRWDRWSRQGPVVGLAAVDAHARIGIDEQDEPRAARTLLARPSYVDMFRTLVQAVWLDAPLSGDAAADSTRVLASMRARRTYSAVAAIATPAVLDVEARAGSVRATVSGAPQAVVSIWRNGREVAAAPGTVTTDGTAAGQYRVEVRWPGVDVPWIVSAPHAVMETSSAPPERDAPESAARTVPIAADGPWVVEHHPATEAAWRADGADTVFTFALARGSAPGQFAALVTPLDPADSVEAIHFLVAADRPMRFSVQVRLPDNGGDGERWVRSVYADPTPRVVRVRLEDFEPAGRPTTRRPVAARLQSLLFVVDAPHTPSGARGTIRMSDVRVIGPGVTSAR